MTIALASDHAGFELKTGMAAFLTEKGIAFRDFGCGPGETVDYVDYGARAAESVVQGECDRAILFCGTGIGMAIIANKFRGIRGTPCWDLYTAEVSRRHNDSNCLTLGGRTLSLPEAVSIADVWLKTGFEGDRHARRVSKISDVEKQNFRD